MFITYPSLGGSVVWGDITGVLADQSDLQSALNALQSDINTRVEGPISSTDTAIPRFVGANGDEVSDSGILIDGSNNLLVPNQSGRTIGFGTGFTLKKFSSTTFGLDANGSTLIVDQNDGVTINRGAIKGSLNIVGNTAHTIPGSVQSPDTTTNSDGLEIHAGDTISGGATVTTGRELLIRGSESFSTSISSTLGNTVVRGGGFLDAGATADSPDLIAQGGDNAGSGAGGDARIEEGISGSGADGIVIIGRGGSGSIHRINGAVEATGAVSLTHTNGPTATSGNPSAYLKININGTDYVIPAWTV